MTQTHVINIDGLKKVPDRLPMIKQTPESYTKFRVNNTNTIFYYNNFDNGLYNENMELLSLPAKMENYDAVISETRSRVKSNKPFWIRILLGHACNYSCDYCLQKDIGNPSERDKITTTDYFINELSKLDFSRLQKIDLWGGETLLYWKTITDIIEKFDRPGLEWYFPTNGTPLMMKHVEYFAQMKGKVSIGISHDGPGHVRLRGEEFLHKKVDVLKALQKLDNTQFSFNPVLSHTNHNLLDINNFFYRFCRDNGLDTSKIGISWTLGRNYDTSNSQNSALHVIHGEELDTFKWELHHYLRMCSEQHYNKIDHSLMNNALYYGSIGVQPYLKTLRQCILPTNVTQCGVDDEGVLSVDMKGNVRTCPHTDDSFIGGHLEELDKVKLKRVDLERYERHCKSCPVFRLCKSNCPIQMPDEVFYTNCAIEKVYHTAVQKEAFRLVFGNEVVYE